jgi:hypothetical protein
MYTNASQVSESQPGSNLQQQSSESPKSRRWIEDAFGREIVSGPFTTSDHGPLPIIAEPGLVIHVRAGCLWVPHHEAHCSVGVGPGETFVVQQSGRITALATEGTEIEFDWPPEISAAARVH